MMTSEPEFTKPSVPTMQDGEPVPRPESAAAVVKAIEEFDAQCEQASYTDTGEAWELLNRARRALEYSPEARDFLAVFEGLVEPRLVDAPPVPADEEFSLETWRKALETAGDEDVCFTVRVRPDGTPELFPFTGGEMNEIRASLGEEE